MENAGLITFREDGSCSTERASLAARSRASRGRHRARAGAPVVRRPRDHGVVGRPLAQRGVRHLDGGRDRRRLAARDPRPEALARKSQAMADDRLATARRIRQPIRSTSDAQKAFDSASPTPRARAVLAMSEALARAGRVPRRPARLPAAPRRATPPPTTCTRRWPRRARPGRRRRDAQLHRSDRRPARHRAIRVPALVGAIVPLRQQAYRTLERPADGDTLAGARLRRRRDDPGQGGQAGTVLHGATSAKGGWSSTEKTPVRRSCTRTPARPVTTGCAWTGGSGGALADSGPLPERERFGVVSNAWAAVRAGQLPVTAFLDLAVRMKDDPSRLVWIGLLDALYGIDRPLREADRPVFESSSLVSGPAARRLGWHAAETSPTTSASCARDPVRSRRSRGGPRHAGGGGAAGAGWLDSPATAAPTSHASRCRSRRSAATPRCRSADRGRDPSAGARGARARARGSDRVRGSRADSADARPRARRQDRTQDLRYLFPALGLRRAARDIVQAWIEQHFDELARLFPTFLMGRIVRAVPALCDAKGSAPPTPSCIRAPRSWRTWRRICASRWRRGCAAPRWRSVAGGGRSLAPRAPMITMARMRGWLGAMMLGGGARRRAATRSAP